MRAQKIFAAILALGLAVTATACGSDDESSSSGGKTITISMIVPTETTAGNYPEEVSGARAAAAAINKAGGVNGYKIKIDYCNEKADINQAAACARKAESSKSIALLGNNGTNTAQAVLPNLKTIPNIAPFALSPDDLACGTCYTFDSFAMGEFMASAPLAIQAGVKDAIITTLDIPAGHQVQEATKKSMEAAGINMHDIIYVPPTTSDMSSYAQKVKDSGAKALLPGLAQSGVFSLLQALKQLDYKPIVITNDNQVPLKDIKSLGSFIEGALFAISLPPASAANDIPALKDWLADMKTQEDSGDKDAANTSAISLHAWLGVHAIAEIAKGIDGDINRESFTAALKSAKDVDMKGILPPWTPSAPAPEGMPKGFTVPLVYFATVKNNDLVLMNKDPWNLAENKFTPVG
jgi:branched-chain amino acid transport system substrate-binding protein